MSESPDIPVSSRRLPARPESPARYWVLAFGLFVLHVADIVLLDLPEWAHRQNIDIPLVSIGQTALVVLAAAGAAAILALAFSIRHNRQLARLTLMAFLAIMAVSFLVFIGLGIYSRSIEPGLITSVLLATPLVLIFRRVWATRE